MAVGILRSCINFNDSYEQKMKSIGENTGNMVFGYALDRLLRPKIIPYDYREKNYDFSNLNAIICTDLIWIREESKFNYLNNILDDTQIPLVPISVGLQASSYDKNFNMSSDTVNLLKRIQERAVIGVRGEYTAHILGKYGIKNISIIGCPSLYYWNNPELRITDNANNLKQISANFRTIYGTLTKYEKHFLSYAADRGAIFVEQTRHILELANTNDPRYYSYVSKWMNENRKIFFSVDEWLQSTCESNFSIGARFHGNVISLWNNMKALFLTVDSRTSELTDYFKLPSIRMEHFKREKSIEYYYDKADYAEFNKGYHKKFENFQQFLNKNGIYICEDVERLQFAQNTVQKKEYEKKILKNFSTFSIMKEDIVQDFIEYKKFNENAKLVLYKDTQVNRWKYRPWLIRMGLPIYAYCIPESVTEKEKIDGINVINKKELEKLDGKVFLLVSTEQVGKKIDIAELSRMSLKNVQIYDTIISRTSMIINDKFRIIDREAYAKSYPWYFELVYKVISEKERTAFLKEFPFVKNAIPSEKYLTFADFSSQYLNIVDGRRVTIGVPKDVVRNYVYLFGDSRIYGDGVPDKYTIASWLQEHLNSEFADLKYEVVNFGIPSSTNNEMLQHLKDIDLKENDIVVFSTETEVTSKININLSLEERSIVFVEPLIEANEYCKVNSASFYFIELGNIVSIKKPSVVELFLKDAYNIKEGMQVSHSRFVDLTEKIAVAHNIAYFNIENSYERPHSYGEIFYDAYHFGPNGTKLIADVLFSILCLKKPFNKVLEMGGRIEEVHDIFNKCIEKQLKNRLFNEELSQYINMLSQVSKEYTLNSSDGGTIVMNCNPFTYGHRYLIETASKMVKHLYILVVEENKSEFTFQDRFEMVKQGCADLKNVTVLPSGKFIISSITLPEYFEKAQNQNAIIDASVDIELFATKIAPALGAKKRFVGEEPFCAITNQYNNAMKKEFPKYGIELIIIPRKEIDGMAISATNVRKLMKEQKYDELRSLVPETTYNYLKIKYFA